MPIGTGTPWSEQNVMPWCEPIAADAPPAAWVWLSWEAGGGEFQVAARLVSIRHEGLSLTCAPPPPWGRRVRVVLDVEGEREYTAEATVASVTAPHRRSHLV